jgi:cell division protein FtsA
MRGVLASAKGETLAALDVGSHKICCFIARPDPDGGRPKVVGVGQQASKGVRSGAINDMDTAEMAIRSAVDAAEKMAGETLGKVVVNLAAGSPLSAAIGMDIAISGQAVADGDLRRAMEPHNIQEAMNGSAEGGREVVHSIATGYAIDGNRGIRDPRGMYGDRLSVNIHVVTADKGPVRNLTHCIERCHLDVAGLVISPYAAGLAALVEDEMELGATIIDMGAGTTSIAVFAEGEVVFTDVLPVGGQHVTNDIARGLSTSRANAERMKTLYGHAMAAAADQRETIEVPQVGEEDQGATRHVPRSLLTGIIQPRLEEIFELVRSRLEASGADRMAGRRVVLVGGASQLPGLRDLASQALDKQVRVGRPAHAAGLAEATQGPAYATCAGLLAYAAEAQTANPEASRTEEREPSGVFGRLGHWLRENF